MGKKFNTFRIFAPLLEKEEICKGEAGEDTVRTEMPW